MGHMGCTPAPQLVAARLAPRAPALHSVLTALRTTRPMVAQENVPHQLKMLQLTRLILESPARQDAMLATSSQHMGCTPAPQLVAARLAPRAPALHSVLTALRTTRPMVAQEHVPNQLQILQLTRLILESPASKHVMLATSSQQVAPTPAPQVVAARLAPRPPAPRIQHVPSQAAHQPSTQGRAATQLVLLLGEFQLYSLALPNVALPAASHA